MSNEYSQVGRAFGSVLHRSCRAWWLVPGRADALVRRGCAVVVALVAAYASYEHQRSFALAGGADSTSATLWPLSVDGLLVLATVGLLAPARKRGRARFVVWVAFLLGIVVSLAANIASAPTMAWQPVLVAGWPPLALLLAVELLTHARREPVEVADPVEPAPSVSRVGRPVAVVGSGARVRSVSGGQGRDRRNAERVMWDHLQRELAEGRIPTGAELDRAAGTNNYGRRLLRKWRRAGLIPPTARVLTASAAAGREE